MFYGCSKLTYVNLEKIYFYFNKDIFKSNLFSSNDNVIVCGLSDFFLNDYSLCEIGTYCINNIYGIYGLVNDYNCKIKCKEELNNVNLTCPYYYPENFELNEDYLYFCNFSNFIGINHNIKNNIIITESIIKESLEQHLEDLSIFISTDLYDEKGSTENIKESISSFTPTDLYSTIENNDNIKESSNQYHSDFSNTFTSDIYFTIESNENIKIISSNLIQSEYTIITDKKDNSEESLSHYIDDSSNIIFTDFDKTIDSKGNIKESSSQYSE